MARAAAGQGGDPASDGGDSSARGNTILGIDPGTATMGWGVVRSEAKGSRLRYV